MESFVQQWSTTDFESSSSLTPQFAAFARDFKKALRKAVKDRLDIVSLTRGHFDLSGFLRNPVTQELVYWNLCDVRYSSRWADQVLIRTAAHERDYTGGRNHFTPLGHLVESAMQLTGGAFIALALDGLPSLDRSLENPRGAHTRSVSVSTPQPLQLTLF